jgi:hypothetical protein
MDTYPIRFKKKFRNLIFIVVTSILILGFSALPGYAAIRVWQDVTERDSTGIEIFDKFSDIFLLGMGFLFLILFICFIGMSMIFLVLGTRNHFIHYVEITPSYIAFDLWPAYRGKCKWKDFERIQRQYVRSIFSEHLIFSSGDIQYGRILRFQRRAFSNRSIGVQISEFKGWPKGKLAEEISQFIPEQESIKEVDIL